MGKSNNKVDFEKVNEYAKALGIPAKGKKKADFINEVLDAIVGQFEANEADMPAEDFEKYKGENQEMLQFYMNNKDYDGEEPEEEALAEAANEAEEALAAEKEKEAESKTEKKAEKEEKEVEENFKKSITTKKTPLKKGAGAERRAFEASLIKTAKYTKKEIVEKTTKQFPEITAATISTELTDGKNPKYNKFDSLVVVGKNDKLSFKK